MLGGAVPIQTASNALGELLPGWAQFPGWEIVTILLVTGVGAVLSKYVVRLLGRPIARRFRRQSVAQTALRLLRVLIVVFASLVGARLVGIQLGSIVLSVTVFSAVLGIILAPIVGSLINGIFLLADQPYEIGDMIELDDGTRGFVDEVNLRYTKIFTLDNTFLVIPNSTIRDRDVVNFSAEDERIRLTLKVLVTYESDVDAARSLIERAAAVQDVVVEGGPDIRIGSARYPAKPTCYIDQYADNGILLSLRYWAYRPYKTGTVRSRVLTELWEMLEESDADVEMAYPHQHLVFDETSGQARVALSSDDDGGGDERLDATAGPAAGDGGVAPPGDDDRPDDS